MKNITLSNNKLLFALIILILIIIIIELSPISSAEDNNQTENNIIPIIKSKNQAEVNETIEFDASYSYINNGTITRYVWHFGDDSSVSTNELTNHKYDEAGKYTVSLGLYDNNNNYNYIQKTINIQETGSTAVSEQNEGSFFQIENIINYIEQNPILPFLLFLLILIVIVLAIFKRKNKNKSKNKQPSEDFSSKNEGVYKIENLNNIVKPKVKREDGLEIKTNVKPTTADFKQDEDKKVDVFKSSKKEEIKQNNEKIKDFDSKESFDRINTESKKSESTKTEFERVEDSKNRERIGTSGLIKQFEFGSLSDDEEDGINTKTEEKNNVDEPETIIKENKKTPEIKKSYNLHSSSYHRRVKSRKPVKSKNNVNLSKTKTFEETNEDDSVKNDSKKVVDVEVKSSSKKSDFLRKSKSKKNDFKNNASKIDVKKKPISVSVRSKRLSDKKRKGRSSERSSLSHRKHRSHVSRRSRLKHAGVSC
jgi:preprotein translocase subunit SecG